MKLFSRYRKAGAPNRSPQAGGRDLLSGLRLLLFSLLMMGSAFLLAQEHGTVAGKVTDAETGEPLPGANVSLVSTFRGGSTGLDGTYSFEAEAGTYKIRVSFVGYGTKDAEVTITAGQTATVDFQLSEAVAEFGETVVIIGSRAERTAVETPVPVDVISELEVRESPQVELNQVLRDLAPSYNASHQTISDGTDHVDPASLRGLGPDQVLVLINGKRRHNSALVNVNGTFGRGTVGTDLNAIPKSAIERVEILRDGAAAQYGSDAIAGVINIVLKEQSNSIQVNGGVGVNNLINQNDDIVVDKPDGETQTFSINYGFKIGENGFFNVTGDYLNRERTNRSATYTGAIFTPKGDGLTTGGQPAFINGERILDDEAELRKRGLTRNDFTMKTGQGEATVGSVFFNTSVPLKDNAEFYAFGGGSHRKGAATGFYRLPQQEERVNYDVYPNGFLPIISTEINDQAITAGLKGVRNGWIVDLSATHGSNSFQFNIENSINSSLGAASPTSFDAGRISFRQTTGNLDVLRNINTNGAVKSLSLALGSEFRVENYQIQAGEEGSYILGPDSTRFVKIDTNGVGIPKDPGSQVFPGFQPSNEVNRYRYSISAYADLESDITDKLLLGVAGRYENYSDFGQRVTGKFAGRYNLVENFAVRGAVSTGFRAPSLPQLWFNNVSIQFVNEGGVLVPKRVLSAANNSPVTKAFGIPQLKEETSVNISAGFTTKPTAQLSITADYYHIEIDNRIVLSSRFTDGNPIVKQILAPFAAQGVSQAQFFANAVDTKTDGVDIVVAYNARVGEGRLTLTGSANITETTVDTTNIPEGVANVFAGGDLDAVRTTLFNREERNRLEDALPKEKGSASLRYSIKRFSGSVRGTYYGKVLYKPTSVANDEEFGAKVLVDIDLGYELFKGLKFSIGANNVFNTFPDKQEKAGNISSGRFVYSRRVTQFGMNGGFYYSRFSLSL